MNENISLNESSTALSNLSGIGYQNTLESNSNIMTADQIMTVMSQVVKVSSENTANISLLSNEVNEFRHEMKNDMKILKNDINELKYNEEITTTQKNKIKSAAKVRVYEIIGTDRLDKAKYYKTFISRLYSNAKKYASMGSKIEETRKGDYQRVMNYIESWTPTQGIENLKREIDLNAEAKREAKELGY